MSWVAYSRSDSSSTEIIPAVPWGCYCRYFLFAAFFFSCLNPAILFAGDDALPPLRISSSMAVMSIDDVDFVYKAGVQESTRISVPIRIAGNRQANYVQLSVDYDRERLSFRELRIEDEQWVLWPGMPVTVDPEGRILATLIDLGGGPRPPPHEQGLHVVSLVYDLLPGNLPADNYRLLAPLSFTPFDSQSLTQDPREETLAGILDRSDEDSALQLVQAHLSDGGVSVYYANGIEIGGGGMTSREQSFTLPLYITHLGEIDAISVGVDYDELILNLTRVHPMNLPAGEIDPANATAIFYRSSPAGADFRLDLSGYGEAAGGFLLREHVADLEFHYAGSVEVGDGAGQGGPVNFVGAQLIVQPSLIHGLGEGRAAGNRNQGLKLLPGHLRILRPYFVRGNVGSSILGYNPPEDGAALARETFRTAPTLSDSVAILRWLFAPEPGRESITCMEAADTDDDGNIQIDDAVLLLTSLFIGGDNPAAPFPYPGTDSAHSALDMGCDVPLPVFVGD